MSTERIHISRFVVSRKAFAHRAAKTQAFDAQKVAKELEVKQAYQDYIDLSGFYLKRTQASILVLKNDYKIPEILLADLHTLSLHAERQIDQIRRRAIQGETIPHAEKVFSLFEPHTEWISKGKAGVPVELGLRVCIMEDSHGFILHSLVCQKTPMTKSLCQWLQPPRRNSPVLLPVVLTKASTARKINRN